MRSPQRAAIHRPRTTASEARHSLHGAPQPSRWPRRLLGESIPQKRGRVARPSVVWEHEPAVVNRFQVKSNQVSPPRQEGSHSAALAGWQAPWVVVPVTKHGR